MNPPASYAASSPQSRMTRSGPALVALAAIMWALDAPLRARLVSSYSAEFIVAAAHVIATIALLPYLFTKFRIQALNRRSLLATLYIAAAGSALGTVLFTQSFLTTTNYNIPILVQKLQPVFAILLARILLKERLAPKFLAYALVAMAGAYLVTFEARLPISLDFSSKDAMAGLLALGAAFLWGSTTVAGRYVTESLSPTATTALRYVFGTGVMVVWISLSGDLSTGLSSFSKDDTVTFCLMALGPGLIALLLYYYGLNKTPARIATLAELAFPVSAVVVNWTVLDAKMSAIQIAGAVILFGAVAMLGWERGECNANKTQN